MKQSKEDFDKLKDIKSKPTKFKDEESEEEALDEEAN